ncbi:hypothetical protein M2R47_08455 [Moraxella sp. Tifton1]|uniref:hypothetical protein n=1 Tax=Moraxella oculi TaxID=2940516 RepID=UPI0020132802|nr:hypothetical protein [Moraxella sp. Tifton1]MCL1624264.1 hypothetical protein [Moraxella sp. Tifton1]
MLVDGALKPNIKGGARTAHSSDAHAKVSDWDLNIGTNNPNYTSILHDKINKKLPIKISGKFKPQEEKDAIRFSQQQVVESLNFQTTRINKALKDFLLERQVLKSQFL